MDLLKMMEPKLSWTVPCFADLPFLKLQFHLDYSRTIGVSVFVAQN